MATLPSRVTRISSSDSTLIDAQCGLPSRRSGGTVRLRWLSESATRCSKRCRSGDPVVALESTIISHGMPYPQNVEMAARGRGDRPQARRDPGDDRGDRRRVHGRDRRSGHRVAGQPDRRVQGDDPRSAVAGGDRRRPAQRPSRPPCTSLRSPGSASSRPAGSAAFTAARRPPSTSRPTSPSWRQHAGRRRVRRREVDPRHRPDARVPRDRPACPSS